MRLSEYAIYWRQMPTSLFALLFDTVLKYKLTMHTKLHYLLCYSKLACQARIMVSEDLLVYFTFRSIVPDSVFVFFSVVRV